MTAFSAPAIETFGLSKRYGGRQEFAVDDLDITIMPGEVYGFLGPNGAGKSTTIRLLMNFIQPTHGHAQILGQNIVSSSVAIKKDIGYLSGEAALYPKMTGRQLLNYLSGLQPAKKTYINYLARLFDAALNQPIHSLSKGNRQKVAIIQAFASQPKVLILDEPTGGLDPLMQEAFFELVRETKARDASLFISSHNLSEVQKICDRVGFIREGELIAEQTIADLARSAVQTYDIGFADKVPVAQLRQIKGLKLKLNSSHHATVTLRGELRPLFAVLAKHRVHTLDRREANLEEEFLKFYRGDKK